MFTIYVDKKEVIKDYSQLVEKWIEYAKEQTNNFNEEKMEFYYSYGFFLPKVENKQDMYDEMFENCSKMLFDERLEFELSKVRVNLAMKMGNFFISNRMEKGTVPLLIRDIIIEITKVKMLVEGEFHMNIDVIDSIPELNSKIVSFEVIRDIINSDYSESQKFDIDSILDKISQKGMDSLSDEERDFLNKKSKDI
jgi:hypothetical protein